MCARNGGRYVPRSGPVSLYVLQVLNRLEHDGDILLSKPYRTADLARAIRGVLDAHVDAAVLPA